MAILILLSVVLTLGALAAGLGSVYCMRRADEYHMLALHFGRVLNEMEEGDPTPETSR